MIIGDGFFMLYEIIVVVVLSLIYILKLKDDLKESKNEEEYYKHKYDVLSSKYSDLECKYIMLKQEKELLEYRRDYK